MKPSDLQKEFEQARKNPKKYVGLVAFCAFGVVVAFFGSKFINGELDSECQNPVYHVDVSEYCGVLEYSSRAAAQCGIAEYNRCRSGPGCGWQRLGGKLDVGKVRANECRAPACGVASYKTCKHEDFGVAKYRQCRHSEHGLERCDDPPPWKFWARSMRDTPPE